VRFGWCPARQLLASWPLVCPFRRFRDETDHTPLGARSLVCDLSGAGRLPGRAPVGGVGPVRPNQFRAVLDITDYREMVHRFGEISWESASVRPSRSCV